MYSNYLEFTQYPYRTDVFLILLATRQPKYLWEVSPFVWTNTSGNTWKTDFPLSGFDSYPVWAVYFDNVELAAQNSVVNVDSTAGSWYFDIAVERAVYVHLPNNENPNNGGVQIAPLRCYCSDIPKNLKYVRFTNLDAVKSNIHANGIVFKRNLALQGLGDISYKVQESAYYGIILPEFTKVELANVVVDMITGEKEFTSLQETDQERDGEVTILHGDGGEVLTLAQHRNFGTFRIINGDLEESSYKVEVSNGFSLFQKKLPPNFYSVNEFTFEDKTFGTDKYKPLFWGSSLRMPTTQLSESLFSFSDPILSPQDSVIAVYGNEGQLISSSEYTVDDGIIIFNEGFEAGNLVEVRAKRCLDASGGIVATQLAGAFMRRLLIDVAEENPSYVPETAFETLDTNYPLQLIIYVGGQGQVSLQDIINTWCKSIFGTLRYINGIYTPQKFDPFNLPSLATNVLEDEILHTLQQVSVKDAIRGSVTIGYNYQPNDDLWKEETKTLSTVRKQHKLAEPPLVINTFLAKKSDAEALAVLYLCLIARERKIVPLSATGEIFNRYPAERISVTKSKAFGIGGKWSNKEFLTGSVKLKTTSRPEATVEVDLEELITEEMYNAVLANLDYPPPNPVVSGNPSYLIDSSDSAIDTNTITVSLNNTGNCVVIKITYNMVNATDDTVPTSVTWAGAACTLGAITSSSFGIRSAIYYKLSATTGNQNAVVTLDQNVKTLCISVQSYDDVISVGDTDTVYQAVGKNIVSNSITVAAGNLVTDCLAVERAPTDAEQHVGAKQEVDFSFRVGYDDGTGSQYSDEKALKARGSHKVISSGITTTMTHNHDYNNQRKALCAIVLQ